MSVEIIEIENRTGNSEVNWATATEREKIRCASLKKHRSQIYAETSALLLQQTKSMNLRHYATATTSADSSPWELKVSLMKAVEDKSWVEIFGRKEIELEDTQFDILVSESQIQHYRLDEQQEISNNMSPSNNKRKLESLEVITQESEGHHCCARDEIRNRLSDKLKNYFEKQSQAASHRAQKLDVWKVKIASLQEAHFVAFGIRL
jgi:hypothetical protein